MAGDLEIWKMILKLNAKLYIFIKKLEIHISNPLLLNICVFKTISLVRCQNSTAKFLQGCHFSTE